MKLQTRQRPILVTILGISIIPAVILVGTIFHARQALIVPLVVILALLLGAVALWARANRNANGSEWWQDDDASGWRDYF